MARSQLKKVRLDSPKTRHDARATLTEQPSSRANSIRLHLVTPMTEIAHRLAARNDLRVVCELGQEVNRLHHEVWPQIFAAPSGPQRDGALMRLVEDRGMCKGAVDTRVIVWKFNARAVKLYEELGYLVRSMTLGKLRSRATP